MEAFLLHKITHMYSLLYRLSRRANIQPVYLHKFGVCQEDNISLPKKLNLQSNYSSQGWYTKKYKLLWELVLLLEFKLEQADATAR